MDSQQKSYINSKIITRKKLTIEENKEPMVGNLNLVALNSADTPQASQTSFNLASPHPDATVSPHPNHERSDADLSDYNLPNHGTMNLDSKEDEVIAYDNKLKK